MKQRLPYKVYIALLLLSIFPASAWGKQSDATIDNDSIRMSLLTCSAGQEIYTLFGHTAIRYENFTRRTDVVYNYGIFNFDAPNFELRFALGETDYQLGVSRFDRFMREYEYFGRNVSQQILNLNQSEKVKLVKLLEENYLPENRIYRYNFFYDNCATRPRDQIEKAIGGTLQYADDMYTTDIGESFRSIIHQYTPGHEWSRLSIDLCLGSKADAPINRREMMFVPFYVRDYFREAIVVEDDGTSRPLVSAEETLLKATSPDNEGFALSDITPLQAGWGLFTLILLLTLAGFRYKKSWWGIDLVLFLTAGMAGCVLAFLVLFSVHPTVSPNYLLFVFHPFHLLLLPHLIIKVKKRQRSWYLMLNCAILTLFILLWAIIPQNFNLAVLPLAACLWIRSLNNVVTTQIHRK
ncbi:MAG: DUF4105 domain-containing protein [Mediterranea sp.]|jgi:hypothetical protein|nr:DUF4105 domain-containing protein [Mediterranea sp.]